MTKICLGTSRFPKLESSSICLGVFDGVHLGHAAILKHAIKKSKQANIPSAVITFDPNPITILKSSGRHSSLMSLSSRIAHLSSFGFDYVLVIKFTPTFAKLSALDFLNQLLHKRLGVKSISVGNNFRFGHKAKGDAAFLTNWCQATRIALHTSKSVKRNKIVISSTRIKKEIEAGFILSANRLLGKAFGLKALVIRGRGQGKRLGIRTANIDIAPFVRPKQGVYAGLAVVNDLKYLAAIQMGDKLTHGIKGHYCEAHIIGLNKDIYGQEICIFPIKYLRVNKRFGQEPDLIAQILKDIESTKLYFNKQIRYTGQLNQIDKTLDCDERLTEKSSKKGSQNSCL
ncbi:MAG: riboflavin kinase/FMN adenylyltransferase [Candidatus Omnitrophota bacterium]|jgi:riboflavin kinase/FMN adenylyltransferase